MKTTLLTIAKTIGDFFLDGKGDGDPMRTLAIVCFLCGIISVFSFGTNAAGWGSGAGFGAFGTALFVLAIWHDKSREKNPPANPTQGQVG